MPFLSPTTLTTDEQKLILRVTAKHQRDHAIISLALGTGLRLGEIVGLNVGDIFATEIAPSGSAGCYASTIALQRESISASLVDSKCRSAE